MNYTIYTYGSGDILEKVLSVLALLCKSDTLLFRPIIALTATVGGTWAALRAILGHSPALFLRDWMLPTVLIFNLMFVPRVTVNIIDNVDTFRHYIRVDHVPVGPALIGHIASNISYFLTEKIEERLVPATYADLTYGKTGPLFAAHLMMASRDLVIADPILRDNMKAYVDQCYTWPYLYTNIAPGREAALKTTNILEFMRTHPHKGLGMYWKEPTGRPIFCKCSEVPAKLGAKMSSECTRALSILTSQVMPGISAQHPEHAERALGPLAENAWHAIAKDSSTAHQRVEQLMIINAGREAIDDALEGFGNERRSKRLISYSATRAEQQQNSGFLIAGLTAARQLPLLQGVFLSLLLISFTLVIAFTFIPGGLKIWGMWIKMILWVESWPIFFGILNCIGLLWLDKSLATVIRTTEGISWVSQSGLAESSWTAYCIVQNFFLAVPFLSWAIISQSGHALVSLAERALPTLGQALGQNIVDNTQTFDTHSFHHRSLNSFQMAQQNLGAHYTLGSTRDDGQFKLTTTPLGAQTVQEYMSTTRHTINTHEALQTQFSRHLSHEQQALETLSHSYTASQNTAADQSFELTKAFAEGQAHLQGANTSQQKELQHAAQQVLSANERYAKQHDMSEGVAWRYAASMGLNILGTGAMAAGNTEASDYNRRQFTQETGLSQDVTQRVSQGLSAALTEQVQFSEERSKRTADSYRSSVTTAQNISDQLAAQHSKVDRFQEMGSYMESQGISITQNLNDDVLDSIAVHKGWDKDRTSRWASQHPTAFREEASAYIQGWMNHMNSWLTSHTGPIDSTSIDTLYHTYKQGIQETHPTPILPTEDFMPLPALQPAAEAFYTQTAHAVQSTQGDVAAVEQRLADTEVSLATQRQAFQKEFSKFKGKSMVRRAGKIAIEKIQEGFTGKKGPRPE